MKALGRVHDDREAHRAAEAALGIFEQVNLDLMYVLPDQTLAEARQDIEAARAIGYRGPVSVESKIASLGNAPMPQASPGEPG